MSLVLRSPLAGELLTRVRRRLDAVALGGSLIGMVVQLVELVKAPALLSGVAFSIALALSVCALLGLLGRARWTPAAYVTLVVITCVVYLTNYGPWIGMGAVQVTALALTFLFLPPLWSRLVVVAFAGIPAVIGLGMVAGVLTPIAGLPLGDATSWRRASVAACTALILLGVLIGSVVQHLIHARRAIEHAREQERAQREAQQQVDADLAHARRADLIAELAAEVGTEVGAALAIVRARHAALAAVVTTADARELLDEIDQAATTAASTMRSLTAFAPPDDAVARAGSVTDAARGLQTIMRRALPARIELTITADDDAWVAIPTTDLTRILSNLVLNARDAIEGTGTIRVRVATLPSTVVIEVSDNGSGMEPAVRARLFQPFFTTKSVGRGTGLGLATARVLVERAGGTVDVDTVPRRGTTFTLRVPAVAPPVQAA